MSLDYGARITILNHMEQEISFEGLDFAIVDLDESDFFAPLPNKAPSTTIFQPLTEGEEISFFSLL